ncbi:MAG: VWA domain-containing protein [Thiolinea sp.]
MFDLDQHALAGYQTQYACGFEKAQQLFPEFLGHALKVLEFRAIGEYVDGARFLCKMGMGVEPSLVYLEKMPEVAAHLGDKSLKMVADYCYKLVRSPNKKSVLPFLNSLGSVCRRIDSTDDLQRYFELLDAYVKGTETVIHGHHSLYESAGMTPLLESMPQLMGKLTLGGIANFIDYGVRNYAHHPEQQIEYFSLKSADAKAIMQRQRQGVLFRDIERHLEMLKSSLWDCALPFAVFSTAFDQVRKPTPYLDGKLIAVPDVLDTDSGVSGLDRYRALLVHLMAHYRWSTRLMADNFAPHMQLFISTFEDCRVEVLAMRRFPGLRHYFLPLHPIPPKGDCDPATMSCLRYRATRLSRALIDPAFDPEDALMAQLRAEFYALLDAKGEDSTTQDMQQLGMTYYVKSRDQRSDSQPDIYFDHTDISYRDDNRYFWFHHEESDEAEDFNPNEYEPEEPMPEDGGMPPRHYDEWDYRSETYRPEWTTVYERRHPAGNPAEIDTLLEKHQGLVKRLKKMIELLRPQNKKRIRFQEDGSELDLDIALRSLIDFKIGSPPDPRINDSYITDSRNIAVLLLVDMSNSLNEKTAGAAQTLLELSQESLAIMAWVMQQLGDQFAIAGFHSDTRHEVRYQHIKGYGESWGDEVKARIAAMEASYSTRMGAAMRHAAHYLQGQQAEKKLLLVLTDGEPADIDVKDPQLLIQDATMAVRELHQQGIYSYCINMDAKADDYVADIFGTHYTVIDQVEKLPEQLPAVFMALTR